MQRWNVVQHELVPMLIDEIGALTPKLEKVGQLIPAGVVEDDNPVQSVRARPDRDELYAR